MKKLSIKREKELKKHLTQVAKILDHHTETEKLQDFETIEWELRNQLLEKVAPEIGEFFFHKGANKLVERKEKEKVA